MTIDSGIKVSSRAIVLLGLVVMLGWHVGILRVVQLHPTFPPMQYNTAVCFLIAGFAAMYVRTRVRLAGALSLIVATIGLVSLLQYALGRSFGIDELVMRGYVTMETSHAGRMAPQTAIGFVLAGLALSAITIGRTLPGANSVGEILQSLLGGLGLAAIIGYIAGIEPAYAWVEATRVALHTACGFVVLSCAILLNSWRLHSDKNSRPVVAIPVVVGGLAVTLVLFQALLTWQVERIDTATAREAARAAEALEARLHSYIAKFDALVTGWSRTGSYPQPTWEADVARFLRDQQIFLAISHIDATGRLDWIFPSAPYPSHVGFDYSMDEQRSAWLVAARERGGPVLTEPLALKSGRQGVLLAAPLASAPGEIAPVVVAAALLDELFRPTALGMPAHRLAVFEGERLIHGSRGEIGARTVFAREVHIDGISVRVAATPLPETIASLRSSLPAVVLASGLLASLLLAATAHLAQVSSRRAAELSAANARLKAATDKLERLALFDQLTGLGNRNLLVMELDKRLSLAQRNALPLPLLLIDLDGFKGINDSFGHDAGDDVLREFAARLTEALPLTSEAFRTGGDEFAVLTKPGTSLDEAFLVAREVERATRVSFLVRGEDRLIGASIGIAAYPHHGQERVRLLRAADVAMYLAKHSATGIEIASNEAPTAVLRAIRQS